MADVKFPADREGLNSALNTPSHVGPNTNFSITGPSRKQYSNKWK